MKEQVIDSILKTKVIAIARGYSKDDCLHLAEALYDGGVSLIEFPFSQTDISEQLYTAQVISAIKSEFSGRMMVGAGTVTNTELVRIALDANADFIVSPNTNLSVIQAVKNTDMVSIPGAFTPTEIQCAWDCDADFVKIFPASLLGIDYIKALKAPLSQVRMLAFGGISVSDVANYINAGVCGVGVGNCLHNKELVMSGNWKAITDNAKKIMNSVLNCN